MTRTLEAKSRFLLYLSAIILVLAMALTVFTVAVKQQQGVDRAKGTAAKVDDATKVLDILKCYTVPGQPCYERNKREQASLVDGLNRVVILASSCAATLPHPTVENVHRCVTEGLK